MKGIYKRSLSLLLALAIIFPFFWNVATSLWGTGVANAPYSVSEFQSEYKEGAETVVEGYIVGYRKGTKSMSKTAEDVENVLSKADMVVVGRSLIHDPRWGQKILNGEKTAIPSELGIDEQALRNKSLWDYVQTLRLDK